MLSLWRGSSLPRQLVTACVGMALLVVVMQRVAFGRWNLGASKMAMAPARAPPLRVAFYTVPKPFGSSLLQQERALASWQNLGLNSSVNFVFSGDSLLQEFRVIGKAYNARGVQVKLDPYGNVQQDLLFAEASRTPDVDVVVVINSDVVLFSDFGETLRLIMEEFDQPFFLVGARYDVLHSGDNTTFRGQFSSDYFEELQRRSFTEDTAVLHTHGGVDYYAWKPTGDPYTAAIGGPIPPFSYGRGKADNWLVKQARNNGRLVIDSSMAVQALHFHHNYAGETLPGDPHAKEITHNYWATASGDPVDMNKYSYFSFGDVIVQEGMPWDTEWAVASCYENRTRSACLQQRIGDPCPCEFSPFVLQTQSPPRVVRGKQVCGGVSPKSSSLYPSDMEGSDLLVRWRADEGMAIILVGMTGAYEELMSSVCRFRQLGIDHYVAVAFNDNDWARCRADSIPCVAAHEQSGALTAGHAKMLLVLQLLQQGFDVVWSDSSVYWASDALPVLRLPRFFPFEALIMMGQPLETSSLNLDAAFFMIRAGQHSISMMEEVRSTVHWGEEDDITFRGGLERVLCQGAKLQDLTCQHQGTQLRTIVLPTELFRPRSASAVMAVQDLPPDLVTYHLAGLNADGMGFRSYDRNLAICKGFS